MVAGAPGWPGDVRGRREAVTEPAEARLQCVVYKGRRHPDVYLYLREGAAFTCVPEGLLRALGPLEAVLHLELHPGRRLAQADVRQVLHQLRTQGYYLQLPPQKTSL
ncbi:MAG: YcgL domain-containing protein [Gammaproteobacteria bacterium]|nr:MAG: YcgL domain-containing protein [Gammaproteobacteria bacterium]